MSYSRIADVYDRFNDLSVYEYWVDYTLNSLEQAPNRMLDLGCGTGWFTQLMAPFVSEIIGLDLDEDMLKVARDEATALEHVQFLHGDMTQLGSNLGEFDLVTCYLDSLCFLPEFNNVEATFDQVYKRLSKGGAFLFDVWTPYQVVEHFDGFQYFDQDDTAALLWESESDEEELAVTHYLTVYRSNATGSYERTEVALTERTYALEAYLQALESAGFGRNDIEVFVDYGASYYDKETDKATDRWFFRCQKR